MNQQKDTSTQKFQAQNSQMGSKQAPPFYRQYWPFGIIFLLVPLGVFFGVAILFSGTIYKEVNHVYQPISQREKVTLLIVGLLFQAYIIYSLFNR